MHNVNSASEFYLSWQGAALAQPCYVGKPTGTVPNVRILGVSKHLYLGDIYLSLQREGHDVRVALQDPSGLRAFAGLIEPAADWRTELDWVGRDGIVMFEGVGQGAVQDSLRADGYQVVGGSALGDRLERDRGFGQAGMRDAGLPIARSRAFADPASAAGRRKLSGLLFR